MMPSQSVLLFQEAFQLLVTLQSKFHTNMVGLDERPECYVKVGRLFFLFLSPLRRVTPKLLQPTRMRPGHTSGPGAQRRPRPGLSRRQSLQGAKKMHSRQAVAAAFFCFARVKVKHNDYDPIGTWGKYGLKGPQNVKRSAAEHFAMMAVWPP